MSETTTFQGILEAIEAGRRDEAREGLQVCNDAYYLDGTSPLTDDEFFAAAQLFADTFGEAIRTAPRLERAGGPRKDLQVGAPLDYPLLGCWLSKATTDQGLQRFLATVAGARKLLSPKWDGLSITLSYDADGRVLKALSRGDDGLGVDRTRVFAGERHFAEGFGMPFGVKFEAGMTYDAVRELSAAAGKEYKNPRNTIAGIFASDDHAARRGFITLIPLDIDYEGASLDRFERLAFLEQLFAGFSGNGERATPWEWAVTDEDADVLEYCAEVNAGRAASDYMLDGVVIEAGELAVVERLGGRVSDEPAWAVANKFPPLRALTKAISVEFDLGATGRRTPCVNFEPVAFNGNTYQRTSIANMTRFDVLRLAPGTPLAFELRGEILGWIDRAGPDPEGAAPFPEHEGLTYTYNAAGQRVFAYDEPPLAGRVERMMIKCGIKGVRDLTLQKLVEAGLIRRLGDAFRLAPGQVAQVPGLGAASARALCEAVEEKCARGLHDWELLASLGIVGIGRSLSKALLRRVPLEALVAEAARVGAGGDPQANAALFAGIENFGPERIATTLRGAWDHRDDVADLLSLHRVLPSQGAAPAAAGPSLNVVVTGDLNNWGRDEFKDAVEALGHKLSGNVSKKTDFLITNNATNTGKRKRAEELGVPILTEAEAIPRLGLDASISAAPPGGDRGPAAGTRAGELDEL